MDKKIQEIINDAIQKVLMEQEILPQNYVQNNFLNQWRVLANAINHINSYMQTTYRDNNGAITKQLYQEALQYIKMTFNNFNINI